MSFDTSLAETLQTFQSLHTIRAEIDRAGELLLATLRAGGKLLTCGNGGSAAEAQHFATELVGRYQSNRRSLPALALSADSALLSCIGNDYGYEQVFSRQIEGLARPGDLVVAFSSSGRSPNIVAALQTARRREIAALSLLGQGGGPARGLATIDVIVPGSSGRSAQEAHLFLIHHFCDLIEAADFSL